MALTRRGGDPTRVNGGNLLLEFTPHTSTNNPKARLSVAAHGEPRSTIGIMSIAQGDRRVSIVPQRCFTKYNYIDYSTYASCSLRNINKYLPSIAVTVPLNHRMPSQSTRPSTVRLCFHASFDMPMYSLCSSSVRCLLPNWVYP